MAQKKNHESKKRVGVGATGMKPPFLSRDQFAKISEVEGIRLTDEMKKAIAEFDRKRLSPSERRNAIIERFRSGPK